MDWFVAPFEVAFVQRALIGGMLVAVLCALVGTWVVLRGMAFLGEAMSHGLLPGVALATLLGGSPLIGAALSAIAMAGGVTLLGRSRRISADTAIGLLFVGMLSLGVIIVSFSRSFAVDITGLLFGDVLAVQPAHLVVLTVALIIALVASILGFRSFVALSVDPRTAAVLGLRPRLASAMQLGLVTLAVVASYHVVGTLLVVGLLLAPAAAAVLWARSIPFVMVTAGILGVAAVATGLLISWHAGTAAGATITAVATGFFALSASGAAIRDRPRNRRRRHDADAAATSARVTWSVAHPPTLPSLSPGPTDTTPAPASRSRTKPPRMESSIR
ncbi:zinc ABC transporter permease AztB [Okibacterium endophyticum]